MIRLAAFDIDGTIRDLNGIPDSTRAAIRRLKENGVQVVLCTGRSEYETRFVREELGVDWAITCNGSHIGYQGNTVFGQAFAKETVERWLKKAELNRHAMILAGSSGFFRNDEDPAYFRRAQREIGFLEPERLRDLTSMPDIYQCIVFCEERESRLYVDREKDGFYVHRWRPWAMDLNPPGTNKAEGLRQLMDHLGVDASETAAFGDGLNDMEMIASVGLGIAMGDGLDALKNIAHRVTKPLREDGIAYAVERWVLDAN